MQNLWNVVPPKLVENIKLSVNCCHSELLFCEISPSEPCFKIQLYSLLTSMTWHLSLQLLLNSGRLPPGGSSRDTTAHENEEHDLHPPSGLPLFGPRARIVWRGDPPHLRQQQFQGSVHSESCQVSQSSCEEPAWVIMHVRVGLILFKSVVWFMKAGLKIMPRTVASGELIGIRVSGDCQSSRPTELGAF